MIGRGASLLAPLLVLWEKTMTANEQDPRAPSDAYSL